MTVAEILSTYLPISLDEMSGIKLMNRMDTKFITTTSKLLQLLEMAREEYRVQEIDGRRIARYYTVYFDTPNYSMYTMHHNGHANRQKLRIRSYVDSCESFLEVKTKNNKGRTKKKRMTITRFNPLAPDHSLVFQEQDESFVAYGTFLQRHLRYDATTLSQQIENRFHRVTLVNKRKTERLTIDFNLCFHNIITGQEKDMGPLVIIEVKRDGLTHSPVMEMLRQLRIHPHGFSKYCMGSALTNSQLKRNRLKRKLNDVRKIISLEPPADFVRVQ